MALAEVNAARAALGLPALAYSAAMAAAAASHARYLADHPEVACCDPHSEQAGTPGFTGADVLDRARAAGFRGYGAAEVVAHEGAAEEAIWNWLATPYHRTPLLAWRSEAAGFAAALSGGDWNQVMNLALRPGQASDLLVFPAEGMTGVPVGWPGLESPDPLRFFPGAGIPVGFTVSVTFPANVRALRLVTARLTGPGGEVPAYLLTPDRDEHLPDSVALLPKAPLEPGTTYRAEFAGTADWGAGLRPFARAWSFTTRPALPTARRASFRLVGGVLRSAYVEGSGFTADTRAYIAGLPVPAEAMAATRLRLELPPGLGGPADLLLTGPGGESVWPGFLTGQELLPEGSDGLQGWSVAVGEGRLGAAALLPAAGADPAGALVPAEALTALGASLERDPATRRWLVRLGARWAVAGPPRRAAWVGEESAPHLGRRVDLPRPPLERDGRLYLPGALLLHLGAAVAVDPGARLLTLAPPGTPFPDLLGHWARPVVLTLAGAGVVSGYPDGTFRPDAPLVRAALIRLAVGATGLAPQRGAPVPVPGAAGHWVAGQGWLQAAVAGGLLLPEEYPLGLEPDQPASRLEMLVMLVRSLGLEAEARRRAGQAVTGFLDGAAVPAAYAGHVQLAVERGLVRGYPEPGGGLTLRPLRQVSRAEAAALLARLRDGYPAAR